MKANVGTIDRVVRIIIGLVLIALVFVGPQTPWGWIGIVPLATALIGFCPAYALFGLNTCARKKEA
jgi:ABC-type polysaccharide/polyol phosphate export permease